MAFSRFPHGISSMGVPVIPGLDWGIGLGNVYWLVNSTADSNPYYAQLKSKVDSSTIFTTLNAAHTACTTGQGDTIFVTPGVYTMTAEMDFTKSHINVIGTYGPNNQLTYSSGRDMHACTFYTVTEAVANLVHVTGYRNNFYGLSFVNAGAAATNLCAVKIGGLASSNTSYSNYFNRCTFHGCMSTSQNTTENCSIMISSGSSNYMFEDCIIGQNTYGGDRATTYQGHVYYCGTGDSGSTAGYATQNGVWRNCIFLSRTATAGIVPVIRIGDHSAAHGSPTGDESWDRAHWWINCVFDNWGAINMPTVFYNNCASGAGVAKLYNCAAYNYEEWRVVYGAQVGEGVANILANMPVSNATDAGIAVEPTA